MVKTDKYFHRINNLSGWFTAVIAFIVYMVTLEPTVSFWDCGEFIASAYRLEIGHPPGAPLFLMMSRVISLFASDPTRVAFFTNSLSALTSAFTVLFLFWTISLLFRKLVQSKNNYTVSQQIGILSAGFVGALAFAFSDTFWFSAVETEVYATSSFFTALVFWAMLKWEENFGQGFNNRWIILIAYLTGLSTGIHLLNLLTIPALVMIWYFKTYRSTLKGMVAALTISFLILALVQYGIIQGTVQLAGWLELYCVNHLQLPYHSGLGIFFVFFLIVMITGLWWSFHKKKILVHTILLGLLMIFAGYGSYAMLLIRSTANPPLNENQPDNVISLLNYLDRDQYGQQPLFYGPYFNAPITGQSEGKPMYVAREGKYALSYKKVEYEYDKRYCTIFPRMYSRQTSHIDVYKTWTNRGDIPLQAAEKNNKKVITPTFYDNLSFFLKYQVGYMYFRYFMWNFAGRQNDIEGNGGIVYGSWISGIKAIDRIIAGPTEKLPTYLKENKGKNSYYFMPMLLGLLGLFFLIQKSRKTFWITFLLFFMTGIAIVLYLNQTPLQPRERDYAFVGSFYAFSIWIGLGTYALGNLLCRKFKEMPSRIISGALALLLVPGLMAFQNYDDHNRSERYTARDIAFNYLQSCAPNAILFTVGDNDTFPLWYLQEVEGIRTDVRVVNLSLLTSGWYIDQQRQKINQADPLPFSLDSSKITDGKRDFVYIIESGLASLPAKEALSLIASDSVYNKYKLSAKEYLDFIPARNLTIPVDTNLVKANGTIPQGYQGKTEMVLPVKINKNYLSKSELMVLDVLTNFQWKQPVYFTTPNQDGTLGLDDYLQLDGFAYRLVPIKSKSQGFLSAGRLESSILFDHLMHEFRWGNMNDPKILIDDQNIQTQRILHTRIIFSRLAEQLFIEGKKDSAKLVLHRCTELMPAKLYPPDFQSYRLEETAFAIEDTQLGRKLLKEHAEKSFQELTYFFAMKPWLKTLSAYERSLSELAVCRLAYIAEKYNQTDLNQLFKRNFKEITGIELRPYKD